MERLALRDRFHQSRTALAERVLGGRESHLEIADQKTIAVVRGACAGRSARVAQLEPTAEIHWSKPCGKPASNCGRNATARVLTYHDPRPASAQTVSGRLRNSPPWKNITIRTYFCCEMDD